MDVDFALLRHAVGAVDGLVFDEGVLVGVSFFFRGIKDCGAEGKGGDVRRGRGGGGGGWYVSMCVCIWICVYVPRKDPA